MYPRYYIFANFAGFLIIFGLLIDPLKAIAISVVAALMINIIICLMIKPLIECVITETEQRVQDKLEKEMHKVIGQETESLKRRMRYSINEAVYRNIL